MRNKSLVLRLRPRIVLLPLLILGLASCAVPSKAPLRVNVANVHRLESTTLEVRLLATLRVQNANDFPIEFSGAAIELQLRGKAIGTGVTDAHGLVPRFGETLLDVPVTISALSEFRQALGLYGTSDRRIDLSVKGRLNGPAFDPLAFDWRGEVPLQLDQPAAGR